MIKVITLPIVAAAVLTLVFAWPSGPVQSRAEDLNDFRMHYQALRGDRGMLVDNDIAARRSQSIYLLTSATTKLERRGNTYACSTLAASTPTSSPTARPTLGLASTTGRTLVRSKTSFSISRAGSTLTIPVYVSQSLTVPDVRVTRAVIAIHGIGRNADGYWDYAAAGLKGVSGVLLVAPQFATADDNPAKTQLHWAGSGWSEGSLSESSGRPWRISSYGVVDEMVKRLRARFVNLRSVAIVGHSAGGQMTQRYASTSTDPNLHFVVMNPGSYLYLSPERPDGSGGFVAPDPAPDGYDDYKYGLRNLGGTPYMAAIGATTLRSRYAAAHVRYLLGALDTDSHDPDLDVRAPAMLQGAHRLERGQLFFRYLGFTFGAPIYEGHTMTVVPEVGHSARGMFGSAAARAAMTE